MNFQCSKPLDPLKVTVINPLCDASKLLIVKILSGFVFGRDQSIIMTLIVYSNEIEEANIFVNELESCAFYCFRSINVTSDMPNVTDADIFCFITNFSNPNRINVENNSDDQFDALYLLIKIADHFEWPAPDQTEENEVPGKKNKAKEKNPKQRPIFISDGLTSIAILKEFSKKVPSDLFFCPSPLPAVAKSVLAETMKVNCNMINNVYVWGANDQIFHVDFEEPYVLHDKKINNSICDWEAVSRQKMAALNLDPLNFSATWMRKNFIEKIKQSIDRNPYGCIYRANDMAKILKVLWSARVEKNEILLNVGAISDGSLGTLNGKPYVQPLIVSGDSWKVSKFKEEDAHLKIEIKRMNKSLKEYYDKLVPYCKNFLVRNVIKKLFIPPPESSITFSMGDFSSSHHNVIDLNPEIATEVSSD